MLRLREVAERLNCSVANVYALRDAGLLHCVATGANGKGFRVTLDELERRIAETKAAYNAGVDVARSGSAALPGPADVDPDDESPDV